VKSIVVEIRPPPPPPAPATVSPSRLSKSPAQMDMAPINVPASSPPPSSLSTFKQVISREGSGIASDQPKVIFDTSANLILLPPRVALATHQYIHNWFFGWYSGYSYLSGAYTIACDHKADVWIELGNPAGKPRGILVDQALPLRHKSDNGSSSKDDDNLTGTNNGNVNGDGSGGLGTNRFKIAGTDLVRERVPVIGFLFNLCYSGIQASKSDEDDWVLGNIFFMNNYVTLDHLNRQVGIATAVRPDLALKAQLV
jgi:hypothetical protein